MEFGCVKGNLPITQGLYQSCVAQMWSRRAGVNPSQSLTRADHMHFSSVMTARMKNKTLSANPPTCGQLATGEGSGGRWNKWEMKQKCFCPCNDSIKELREQRIHTSVRVRCSKFVHAEISPACMHAHTQPDNFRQGVHGSVKLTEEMTNCCWGWISSRQGWKDYKVTQKKVRLGRLFKLKVKPASVGCRKGG